MTAIKHILVPTDFSDTASRAVEYAKTLADAMGASVHLLHVLQDPFATAGFEAYVPPPEYWENIKAHARAKLERVLAAAEWEKLKVSMSLAQGFPANEIVQCARERGIDLIVMGTHGRGPLTRFLLGSVADKVVRKAPCPVLTVHPPEPE